MNHLEYRHLVAEKTALDDTISKLSPGASDALRSPLELRRRRILDRLEGWEGVPPSLRWGLWRSLAGRLLVLGGSAWNWPGRCCCTSAILFLR